MSNQKQEFDHKLYRKLARLIHEEFCEDREWCNYGEPSENLRLRSEGDPLNDREHLIQHCQAAVDAENISAAVQFAKGSKVRKR